MTTADTGTAKPSLWRRFTAWRRGRPFWGGLLSILAGIEIFSSTQQSIGEMDIKVGMEGMQAYVIPLALVFAGFLAWFTPAQRHFYGLLVPVIAVYALIGVNFGGWFVGTILGMIGGAMIFAWSPAPPRGTGAADRIDAALDGDDDPAGSAADEHTPRHAVGIEELIDADGRGPRAATPDEVPAQRNGADEGSGRGRLLGITMIPLLLVAVGIVAARGAEPAYAAGCPTSTATATKAPKPTRSATVPKPSTSAETSTAPQPSASAAEPSASPSPNLLQQIVGGLVSLVTGGKSSSTPKAQAAAEPSASAPAAATTPRAATSTKPAASKKPAAPTRRTPSCQASPSASPSATAKHLLAAAGQPNVGVKPSRMTGTLVTMTNLVFQGVVDLPTDTGKITVLKFTMDSSVTDNFNLHVYGSREIDISTRKLTVKDNVVFYTSEFKGNLLGLIPVDYTPTNLPPAIPLPLIFFSDPDIQLVWVNSDILTGPGLVTEFS
ncbi:DUF6114 domain-containing protein [Hamadaea tsunoensis]|uniref:DUF6114 domain-containing protein n=1 Tax=Hamadaea tsunoensis TaxID=53368 RepID=UPI0003FD19DC|nr:DUF6114 domain-containing protein [Hamadaea tsunoensis]